ncbi:cobyrinate a,c-diamide synthase [Vandammella animalimorsus]|uniref:cobyrinate a,c-diamide synthase n=1 Tax=Vandammella animalimorsus TaxID=2029117 RepID=UPI0031B9B79E
MTKTMPAQQQPAVGVQAAGPQQAQSAAVAHCPALLVAAAASGQGKTLVTAALARLHSRQGRRVRVFKCGPDFLDPHWHELASGAPVQNLDLWMTGPQDVAARLHAAACQADLILIEGVMGLFDGTPSAADLAQQWGIAVMPVLQAGAMAQTCAALVYGLKHYRSDLRWAGVLCNGVASAHHAQLLQAALEPSGDWLGALPPLQLQDVPQPPQGASGAKPLSLLPERHLGLVPSGELRDALARLDLAADALAQTPLGQMDGAALQRWQTAFALAEPAPAQEPRTAAPASDAGAAGLSSGPQGHVLPPEHALALAAAPALLQRQPLRGQTVAIARDAAFAFIYAANLELLQALGARLAWFSPLAGDGLPACDALWLPGGYPELHAARLHANAALRQALHEHWAQGKPIWAECGGMVALCAELQQADGALQPLWGLLPAQAVMQQRLAGLGPQQWLPPDAPAGEPPLRGHTFHYSRLQTELPAWGRTQRPAHRRATAAARADAGEAVYRLGSLTASYFHAWFPSSPQAVLRLLGPGAADDAAGAAQAAAAHAGAGHVA